MAFFTIKAVEKCVSSRSNQIPIQILFFIILAIMSVQMAVISASLISSNIVGILFQGRFRKRRQNRFNNVGGSIIMFEVAYLQI